MDKERIGGTEFYALRRKLWVETVAGYLGSNGGYDAEYAGKTADAAVKEFDKRFRAV
jgi:hypothetical protein